MSEQTQEALRSVALFVPKLLGFLLILVLGILIARLIAKAVDAILERVGFDRAVERGGIKRALENSKYDASDVVSKLVYYTLLLFVLQLAFGLFGDNPISELLQGVIAFLPKAFVAIIIVVVAAAIASAVKDLITGALGGLSYGKLLGNIASIFILGIGVIAALNQVEIAVEVTQSVLIFVLATIGGILVVGVGGGLIRPMQARWDRYLSTLEAQAPAVKQEAERARMQQGSTATFATSSPTSSETTTQLPAVPPTTPPTVPPAGGATQV